MGTALADTLPTTSDRSALMTSGPDSDSHPDYFQQRQRAAWDRYNSLPTPTRKDETWRFAELRDRMRHQLEHH